MVDSKADLILHPIRLRIITAISSYRLAARELAEALPDVPLTTLYRHINALLEGGLLKIVEEKPIRGTVERTYALTSPPSLTSEDMRDMGRQECEQAFTVFLSTLMSDAQRYLNSRPGDALFNPIDDGIQISKVQIYMDDEEFKQMSEKLLEMILKAASNEPRPGRRKRIFSNIFIPLEIDHSINSPG